MKTLEEKFGKPHPELEGFKPVSPRFYWLQAAYFRMHRRRQISEMGLQPLPLQDIYMFAEKILHLTGEHLESFIRIIEHVDSGVLYDFYKSKT